MLLGLEGSHVPLFGSKKKEKPGTDIEAAEEDGLFVSRSSEGPETEVAPVPPSATTADGESGEPEPSLDSALEEEVEPEPESDEAPAEPVSVAAKAEGESGVDDLMAAFQDDETHGELADITKELDDVPMADLLAELRDIRGLLPAEALENTEDAA